MMDDEAYNQYRREQSREWMRRKRERDPEGTRALWRKHSALYRQRHPERVKAAQAKRKHHERSWFKRTAASTSGSHLSQN